MIEYKYKVQYSTRFKKNLKRCLRQGKDIEKLKIVVDKLANEEVLEFKYKNHKLINNKYYKDCYECHIEPDWLLVYQYIDNELVLLLIIIGSHSEVLDM